MKNVIKSKCPLTGLTIKTHPDWTNVSFGSDHFITFKVIEDFIILAESEGTVTIESLKGTLNLSKQIINNHIGDNPFVYMENLNKVSTISVEGRKYYIQFLKNLKNLKMLIYFNAKPFLRLSIKLAKRINFFNFDIQATKTYLEAIDFSLKKLNKEEVLYFSDVSLPNQNNLKTWVFDYENFKITFEQIDNKVLHLISEGVFDIRHVDAVVEFQNNIIKEIFKHQKGNYYLLFDVSKVSITKECRTVYAKKMQKLYKEFPFKCYIYYGQNRLIDIVVIFVSRFIKFKIKKVKSFEDGIKFIENDIKSNVDKYVNNTKNQTQKYIDEYINFLSQVNWEKEGIDESFQKDITHPFYKIYDAITLIKSDLDELYLERKKNEEEKAILQHKLQQSLKLEAMGKLAGSVAHDLNNVLSGIVSYPDIILKKLPATLENEKAITYIKRMQKSGQKAADIVQDLLTLSRRGVVNFEIENLNSVVEDYLNSPEFQKLVNGKQGIIVETKLDKNLSNISGSKIHLLKAIMNLVTNAVEAIDEKGRVKISTQNTKLENKFFEFYNETVNGEFVELSVSDSGTGITKQDKPKIFEPFYSKKIMGSSGTGLGMMVIKGAVDDHKGFIDIISEVGLGTEFKLYFPISEEKENNNILKKIDSYTGKGEKILIIDDDEDQRIIATEILKGLYYSVESCASGEEAIEYFKNKSADLIILDMIMAPGIGGLETYKQILKIKPNQKAIVVSGYSASHKVMEVQKLGAGKFIRKPYTTEEIGIAVFEELNK